MGFYYRDDFTLIPFTTTKVDVKKNVSRMPHEAPEVYFEKIKIYYLKKKIIFIGIVPWPW